MLQIIIFSYNRAMQLDTLLLSLYRNWREPKQTQIDVLYNYSSGDFGDGYDRVISEYSNRGVVFHKEGTANPDMVSLKERFNALNIIRLFRNNRLHHPKTDFRSQLNSIIEESEAENIMFLTDDCKFVGNVIIPNEVFSWVNVQPNIHQFSLRLGKQRMTQQVRFREYGNFLEWDIYKYDGDSGYPFSVDGHIYNKIAVLKLLKKYIFINPNTLEAYLVGSVRKKHLFSKCRCFNCSVVQTFPINIVQNEIINGNQNVSVEMLNSRYLNGERLDYIANRQLSDAKQHVGVLLFTNHEGKTIRVSIE